VIGGRKIIADSGLIDTLKERVTVYQIPLLVHVNKVLSVDRDKIG
jgi:hypothetical protein